MTVSLPWRFEALTKRHGEDPINQRGPCRVDRFRAVTSSRFRDTLTPHSPTITIMNLEKKNTTFFYDPCARTKRVDKRKMYLTDLYPCELNQPDASDIAELVCCCKHISDFLGQR